jgi:hypothetical protein
MIVRRLSLDELNGFFRFEWGGNNREERREEIAGSTLHRFRFEYTLRFPVI